MDEETHPTTETVYPKNMLILSVADLQVGLLIKVFHEYILAADRCVQRLIRRMSRGKPVLKEEI